MPLVRISLLNGKTPDQIRAVCDGVHRALVETYAVPHDDRFQIVEQVERDSLIYDSGYLGRRRSDDVVFIHIFASDWRDTAQKKALYAAIADNLARDPGLRRDDVHVVITPNTREDWSLGGGVASYVKD